MSSRPRPSVVRDAMHDARNFAHAIGMRAYVIRADVEVPPEARSHAERIEEIARELHKRLAELAEELREEAGLDADGDENDARVARRRS